MNELLKKQNLGYIGSILMIVAPLLPFYSAPFLGNITYFHGGKGDGVLVMILGVIALLAVWKKKYRISLAAGVLGAIMPINTYLSFLKRASEMDTKVLGIDITAFIKPEIGCYLTVLGIALVIFSAFKKD